MGTYCYVSALLFTLVEVAHLIRVFGWPVQTEGISIAMLVSFFGYTIPGALLFLHSQWDKNLIADISILSLTI
ncbi:MAG: hypothetical protein ACJA13_000695 [Paraglaciecola sp.]|jgi:hypothetical protein